MKVTRGRYRDQSILSMLSAETSSVFFVIFSISSFFKFIIPFEHISITFIVNLGLFRSRKCLRILRRQCGQENSSYVVCRVRARHSKQKICWHESCTGCLKFSSLNQFVHPCSVPYLTNRSVSD